jgi:hypothetical protein
VWDIANVPRSNRTTAGNTPASTEEYHASPHQTLHPPTSMAPRHYSEPSYWAYEHLDGLYYHSSITDFYTDPNPSLNSHALQHGAPVSKSNRYHVTCAPHHSAWFWLPGGHPDYPSRSHVLTSLTAHSSAPRL